MAALCANMGCLNERNPLFGNALAEDFIARFRQYREPLPVDRIEDNTLMNWAAYSGIRDEDLGAIYDFLRSLPPVRR